MTAGKAGTTVPRSGGQRTHADPGWRRNSTPATTNQQDMDEAPAQQHAPAATWPAWVQRCGIGSSCGCGLEQQRAGLQRDSQHDTSSGDAASQPGGQLAYDSPASYLATVSLTPRRKAGVTSVRISGGRALVRS
jgi:hypothetical protein